jgi:hypothetical protein
LVDVIDLLGYGEMEIRTLTTVSKDFTTVTFKVIQEVFMQSKNI